MSIPVKLFRSSDTNAPTLNGTAGSLIAVLDACLVNGYNAQTIQSITRNGQVATVTFALAHGFPTDGLTAIRQAGLDQPEYNGDFHPANITANSYDITVTGSPASPATGNGTAKVAPVDWIKAFSAANKAAYRSDAVDATRLFLRIDDNNPIADGYRCAGARGYETLSDIDTGSGLFPTVAQAAAPRIIKSSVADASVRHWLLIADDRELLFFYSTRPGTFYQWPFRTFHFGDIASEFSSDPYGCMMMVNANPGAPLYNNGESDGYEGHMAYVCNYTLGGVATGHYMARGDTQIGQAIGVNKISPNLIGNNYMGYSGFNYPTRGNNQLYLAPVFVTQSDAGSPMRGQMKCWYNPMHGRPLANGAWLDNVSLLPGRRLFALKISATQNNDDINTCSEVLLDLTGPWR